MTFYEGFTEGAFGFEAPSRPIGKVQPKSLNEHHVGKLLCDQRAAGWGSRNSSCVPATITSRLS